MEATALRIVWFSPVDIAKPRPRGPGGTVRLTCCGCGVEFDKSRGNYEYQLRKDIDRFFCKKACFYESRRLNQSIEEKKRIKADYDNLYRRRDYVKVKKAESFKRNYDPAKAAVDRQKRMPRHVEYCRQPAYRVKKKEYDQVYRAKMHFGEFWESAILINQIEAQYDQREVRQINNLQNKTQKRKRAWKTLKRPNSRLPQ